MNTKNGKTHLNMKLIKKIIILIFLLKSSNIQAQYRENFDKYPFRFLQQSDSLYKANKVKARIAYLNSFNTRSLLHEIRMDNQGRITTIIFQPFMSVQTRHTQFTYTDSGSLSEVQDVFEKGKDSKFYQELISKDKKLKEKYKAMPDKIYYNYTISNPADTIKIITRINEKGDTISQSTYANKGLAQHYKEFGQYGADATTIYINHPSFLHLPVSLAYKSLGQAIIVNYEYVFNEQNRIVKMIARNSHSDSKEPYSTDTYTLEYDINGLLQKAKSQYVTYEYDYKFYK